MSDPCFWWNHLNPEDHAVALLEDSWEENRPFQVEYRMRRQDGGEVWLRDEAVIVRDPQTRRRLTRGVLIDITERKCAEKALRRSEENYRASEERYRTFVEQSSEGIFCMEYNPPVPCHLPIAEQLALGKKNGYLAECNDALAKMYGRASARELIGKPLADFLILNDPGTRQFMENFVQAGYQTTDQESYEMDSQGQKDFSQHHERGGGGRTLGADLGHIARRDGAAASGRAAEERATAGGDRAAGGRRGP